MFQFKVQNTIVQLEFLFVATVTLCILLDKSGILFYSLLASLMHEIGHLAAFCVTGYAPRRLSFHLFGMTLQQKSPFITFQKELCILLAGSVVNLAVFSILLVQAKSFSEIGAFGLTHLCVGMLNLLPLHGFDGGEVVSLWLVQMSRKPILTRSIRILQLALVLILSVSVLYYTFTVTLNISMLLFVLYLWISFPFGSTQ